MTAAGQGIRDHRALILLPHVGLTSLLVGTYRILLDRHLILVVDHITLVALEGWRALVLQRNRSGEA